MKQSRLTLTLSIFLVFSLYSLSAFARQFGYDGRDGYKGSNATPGESSGNIQVFADRGRQYIDIAGGDARNNAQAGRNGEDASSCYQQRTNYDLYGADGGRGGNGGNGGRGGNGGDALIFFDHVNQLSNIQIDNSGGYGSEGAQGSYGGRACRCDRYSWYKRYCYDQAVCRNVRVCSPRRKCRNEVQCRVVNGVRKCTTREVCETVQECRNERRCHNERRCEDRRYTCRDGRDGVMGRSGSSGSKGFRGHIKIAKNVSSLPKTQSSKRVSIRSLLQAPVILSKNIWRNSAGARSLFAQGSNIGDRYAEYIETAYNEVSAEWNASKPVDEFTDMSFDISFNQGGNASINLRSDDLIDYDVVKQGHNQSKITVNHVFKASEVSQLTDSFNSNRRDFQIVIHDASSLSQIVKSRVYLSLDLNQLIGSKNLFNGFVPGQHMDIKSDTITIYAGRLVSNSNKLRRGRKIRYSLSIDRSFGASSKKVKLRRDKVKIQ